MEDWPRGPKFKRREPKLELLEVAWRMRSPRGRILECGLYATDVGFEARVGYGDDLIESRFAKTRQGATEAAAEMRAAVKATFTVLVSDARENDINAQ